MHITTTGPGPAAPSRTEVRQRVDLATYFRTQPAHGQPWDERPPGCKCYRVEPVSIADRPGREAMHYAPEDVMTQWNRCKYFLRPGGCYNGDNCPYCHVHPVPKHLWLCPMTQ